MRNSNDEARITEPFRWPERSLTGTGEGRNTPSVRPFDLPSFGRGFVIRVSSFDFRHSSRNPITPPLPDRPADHPPAEPAVDAVHCLVHLFLSLGGRVGEEVELAAASGQPAGGDADQADGVEAAGRPAVELARGRLARCLPSCRSAPGSVQPAGDGLEVAEADLHRHRRAPAARGGAGGRPPARPAPAAPPAPRPGRAGRRRTSAPARCSWPRSPARPAGRRCPAANCRYRSASDADAPAPARPAAMLAQVADGADRPAPPAARRSCGPTP